MTRPVVFFIALLVGLQSAFSAAASERTLYGVGSRALTATVGQPLPLALWYPSLTDGTLAPGRFPLVLFSHGSGGSERNQRGFAATLARHGYVVVAPRHWGDSYDRPSGRGSDVQLIGRPLQAHAALDTVLADAHFGPGIDPQRIGMLGFSAGGYTTLVMAGARPDFGRWKTHCQAHASEDDEFCPMLVWRLLPRITRRDWQLPATVRIKAAVAMAPASILFDKAGLAGVTIPLRLYGARDDRITPNRWHADRIAAALPSPHKVNLVPGGHYIFLAPCTPELLAELPRLCVDAPGIDRAALHEHLGRELVAFFDATL